MNSNPRVAGLLQLPAAFPGMDPIPTDAVYLMGCGNFSQYCSTLRSLLHPSGFCPFCTFELTRRSRKPIRERGNWLLLGNEYPRKETKQMLLIVPKPHYVSPIELNQYDWGDVGILMQEAGVESGGLIFRFGDPRLHAGTIQHLHFNLIEPITGMEYRPPLAKTMEKHMQDYQRMIGFMNDLVRYGGLPWLFSDKGINETQPAAV